MMNLKSPLAVVWEITNNCNYRCPHCRAYMAHTSENEETENKIIAELIRDEVLAVNLSGGEPLIHPRVGQIVSRLASAGMDVGISSNGWFFLEKGADLREKGLNFIQVSLDGPKELHDAFRGVDGAYEHALDALRFAKSLGLRTQMNVTITSKNLQTLLYNLDVAKEIGVDRIFYRRVVPAGKGKENRYLLPPKKEYLMKLTELSQMHIDGLDIAIDDPILPVLLAQQGHEIDPNRCSCNAGINSVGIDSNGTVYPCIFLREEIGNIHTSSLHEIWKESELLKKLRNRDYDGCGKCKYSVVCGGCRAYSGLYDIDEMCPLESEKA